MIGERSIPFATVSAPPYPRNTRIHSQKILADWLGLDSLVQAKTGTGKTTAFLLPAIQNTIIEAPPRGQVAILILSPTRELALQIAAEASQLVSRLRRPLQVHTAFGGTAKEKALKKFIEGDPKILVATPGRLDDYLGDMDVRAKFNKMKTLVLDEADRMLDAGFLPAILKILNALPSKITGQWQGMCFSVRVFGVHPSSLEPDHES